MGAAIISRRLTKAGLNVPRAFRDVETGGAWRAVASDLTARPAAGGCSDRIVADVLRGYALFAEAAQTSHRVAA